MKTPHNVYVLAVALTCFALPYALPALRAQTPPSPQYFDVYALMGQSNMAGVGDGPYAAQNAVDTNVLSMNLAANGWQYAVDPLHFDFDSGTVIGGTNIGRFFGLDMHKLSPGRKIGLVPCAVGASYLNSWVKGATNYQRALTRTRAAQTYGTLRGVLWLQGEQDGLEQAQATTYAARLTQVIADFRNDVGVADLPFVIGEINVHCTWPYSATVNEQLRAVAQSVANVGYVKSEGLFCGDDVHFRSHGKVYLGSEYARAMAALLTPQPENGSPAVRTVYLPSTVVGEYYEHRLMAAGGNSPLQWTLHGTLPQGLELTPFGLIKGTPSSGTPGRYDFRIGVADADSPEDARDYTLIVTGAGNTVNVSDIVVSSGMPVASGRFSAGAYGAFENKNMFHILPYFLDGANNDADYLSFGVDTDAWVHVLYPAQAMSLPGWMSAFTNINEFTPHQSLYEFNVYSREFPAGRVVLGGSDAPSHGHNGVYYVVVDDGYGPASVNSPRTCAGARTRTAVASHRLYDLAGKLIRADRSRTMPGVYCAAKADFPERLSREIHLGIP